MCTHTLHNIYKHSTRRVSVESNFEHQSSDIKLSAYSPNVEQQQEPTKTSKYPSYKPKYPKPIQINVPKPTNSTISTHTIESFTVPFAIYDVIFHVTNFATSAIHSRCSTDCIISSVTLVGNTVSLICTIHCKYIETRT
eukprot:382254_1